MAADADIEAPILQTTDLTFSLLPGGQEQLRKVSLSLPPRARCVVVGQNGAGKTTLLELLAGSKMAPAGSVKVCGEDPFRGASGKQVALVQGGWRGTAGEALGEDRLAFLRVGQLLGLPDSNEEAQDVIMDERTRRLHETFDIQKLIDRYVGSLSDGERRKVELARKLKEPKRVVLLDEATMDLDLLARKVVLDFLAAEDATVVNVTHVFDGLESWATHLVHLHDGEILRCEQVPAPGPAPWAADGGLFSMVAEWLRAAAEAGDVGAPPPLPAAPAGDAAGAAGPVVSVRGLSFAYADWCPVALRLDELDLPPGCRCALVGPNGAGKSSLLNVLGGRRMVKVGDVRLLGLRAFYDHAELDKVVALLSSEWKRQVSELNAGRSLSFREISATALQDLVTAGHDMARLAGRMLRLIQMLNIDPAKQIGTMSDGMMRRVQIALKLLRPSKVVLVDEVTADLDILARQALLGFLREESEAGCAVVYCTHIMDGLGGWATHMLRMRINGLSGELLSVANGEGSSRLLPRVLSFLKEDAALPPLPRWKEPRTSERDAANLPSGWLSRGATQAGAYGSYAWNADRGSEDTWSFSSVAPAPGPPQPVLPAGAVPPGVALTGALGSPPQAAAFGQQGVQPHAGSAFAQSPFAAPAAPCAYGQSSAFSVAPVGASAAGFGHSAHMGPLIAGVPCGAAADGPAAAPAPSPAPSPSDGNPFGGAPRANQMSYQELVAQGIIKPDPGGM